MQQHDTARFDRLILGWGQENQKKVAGSRLSIITESHLGKYIASYLVSAGFGNLRMMGPGQLKSTERFLWSIPLERPSMAQAYADAFPQLNPSVEVVAIRARMDNAFIRDQLRKSDVLVDATNDPCSKAWTLDTAMLYRIPAVSASSDRSGARFCVFSPDRDKEIYSCLDKRLEFMMQEYSGRKQDELVAMGFAGMVDEEIKKFVLDSGEVISGSLSYAAPRRPGKKHFQGYNALVVGAGAAGNKVIPALAMMGFGYVDIVDDDPRIEVTNLPRMEFFAANPSGHKDKVLAQEASKVFPNTRFRPIHKSFRRDFSSDAAYDVIISCVDNDYARGEIYEYATRQGIPHLDIGTDFDGFNYALAVPEKTACIRHYFPGFEEQVAHSEAMIRTSCERAEASNSWMQCGAVLGILELPRAFYPEVSGEPFNGYSYYDAGSKRRLNQLRGPNSCKCWRDTR